MSSWFSGTASSCRVRLPRGISWRAQRSPLADVDIVTLQNPFNFLKRDSDIEGLSDGFDERTAYGAPNCGSLPAPPAHLPAGYVDGIDDPDMGWARYAQTIRIFVLNSGLFYITPSNRTARHAAARWIWVYLRRPRRLA